MQIHSLLNYSEYYEGSQERKEMETYCYHESSLIIVRGIVGGNKTDHS